MQKLFKHYYHLQCVFTCADNKVCLLLGVDPHHAGAHHGFLFPPRKVQRKANLKSGGREES